MSSTSMPAALMPAASAAASSGPESRPSRADGDGFPGPPPPLRTSAWPMARHRLGVRVLPTMPANHKP